MGGMVLETNMTEILARVEEMNKQERSEAGISAAPSKAISAVKEINLPSLTQKIIV